jgi:hypothetical protein
MNAFPTNLYRDVTCGSAAMLITAVLSLTFVQSTALPPGMHSDGGSFIAVQPAHAWFGQPEPAVLVD